MCNFFWQSSMDGGGGRDLVDIIRSIGGHNSMAAGDSWRFPTDADASFRDFSTDNFAASCTDAFDLRDPLLTELVGTTFSDCGPDISRNDSYGGDGGGSIQKPTNIFSRAVQILPAKHSMLMHMIRGFPMGADHGVHTSSARAQGIKRRGYYRCSSSKGCLARKQVERSRSDPNMLVNTYTSEHNHTWPAQRNALAGSTRSSNTNKNHKITPPPKISNLKEVLINTTSSSSLTTKVKEELMANDPEIFDKLVVYESDDQSEDFFADLVELESDLNEGVDPFVNMVNWEQNVS